MKLSNRLKPLSRDDTEYRNEVVIKQIFMKSQKIKIKIKGFCREN